MLIDWFTVAAQIVNFLILIGLLKRFLYGRIIAAMDQREQAISSRLEEAEQKGTAAEHQHRKYVDRHKELEEAREELITRARRKAADLQKELEEKARSESQDLRQRLHESLQQEQESFLRDLRNSIAEQVCAAARRALHDMADADLEKQVLATFVGKIERADESLREEISRAIAQPDATVTVLSAFRLDDDSRAAIEKTCREIFGLQGAPQYRVSGSLLAGICLTADGTTIEFSFSGYLDDLCEEVRAAVAEEAPERFSQEAATEIK